MNTDKLLEFLDDFTNYFQVTDDSYRCEDVTRLEFELDLHYLYANRCNWAVKNIIKYDVITDLSGYDKEGAELIMEERLIHPVILAQKIMCNLLELVNELFSAYFENYKQFKHNFYLLRF